MKLLILNKQYLEDKIKELNSDIERNPKMEVDDYYFNRGEVHSLKNILKNLQEVELPDEEEIERLALKYANDVYPIRVGDSESNKNWLKNQQELIIIGFTKSFNHCLQLITKK